MIPAVLQNFGCGKHYSRYWLQDANSTNICSNKARSHKGSANESTPRPKRKATGHKVGAPEKPFTQAGQLRNMK